MAMFIMPTVSPMRTSTAIATTASFGARYVQQLRLGFHRGHGELDGRDHPPCFPQVLEDNAQQAVQQLLFDFGDVALNVDGGFARTAQQHFQNGENQRGVQLQHSLTVIRFQP
jgi:hypothetical protein